MAGFRAIWIKRRAKLSLQNNYMVIREASDESRIFIEEMKVLLIDNQQTTLTSALFSSLVKSGVTIINCDHSHLPVSVTLALHSHHSSAYNIRKQIAWKDERKKMCWLQVIHEKIYQQQIHLQSLGLVDEASYIEKLLNTLHYENAPLVEAQCASKYFKSLFGSGFTRNQSNSINKALNYGYSILLSLFSNEITLCGYVTELGLWHSNQENAFNLSSDLMEPFRIAIDKIVSKHREIDDNNFKSIVMDIFNCKIMINEKEQYITSAIPLYLHRCFGVIEEQYEDIFNIEILGSDQ